MRARLECNKAEEGHINGQQTDDRTPMADGAVQVNVTGNGFGYYKAPGDAKFYGANLLSELDQPGEYYLDERRGTLYGPLL